MPDSARRALRSLFQVGVVEAIIQVCAAYGHAPTTEQHGAIITLATLLFAFCQNWLEDAGAIPSVGKAAASSGKHPVTHDPIN